MSWSGGETRRFPQVFGGLQLIPSIEEAPPRVSIYPSNDLWGSDD